jgi:antitoxin Phd
LAILDKVSKIAKLEGAMARFSLTELSNKSGEVVEAAFKGPVEITRHGKRKFVLLTADDYDRLANAADKRRAYHVDNLPEDVADLMLTALERDDD